MREMGMEAMLGSKQKGEVERITEAARQSTGEVEEYKPRARGTLTPQSFSVPGLLSAVARVYFLHKGFTISFIFFNSPPPFTQQGYGGKYIRKLLTQRSLV